MSHLEHADHLHKRSDGCGHVAIPHNGHVDYVRDASHDDHWDEH
jgi:hypothetical protein